MNINLLPLFASNVFYFNIDEDTSELDPNDFEWKQLGKNNFASSLNTYSTTDIRVLEKYPNTKKILLDKFKQISKDVLSHENDFNISTSWFTKTEKGGYCNFHSHRHCLYSGIYYFDNNYSKESAKICFRSRLNQFSDYWITSKNDDIVSASKWHIAPEAKKLILFPSYLEHAILKHNEDTTRYSLAFNLFPIGEYGDGDSSYNTDWLQK